MPQRVMARASARAWDCGLFHDLPLVHHVTEIKVLQDHAAFAQHRHDLRAVVNFVQRHLGEDIRGGDGDSRQLPFA